MIIPCDFRRQMKFFTLSQVVESFISFTGDLLNMFFPFQVVSKPNSKAHVFGFFGDIIPFCSFLPTRKHIYCHLD